MKPAWPRPTGHDVVAGVSVALLLIPQAVAYAQIAELPPVTGLFASALPLIVAAPFASSPTLQTGPVALTSLLTLAALQGAGFTAGDPQYVALAALLAVMVGVFRLLLGLIRVGWIAYLIADPVLTGFASAAAVLIMTSQLAKTVGNSTSTPAGSTVSRAFWAITNPGTWSASAIVLSLVTLAVMLGGRRLGRFFPGVAVAVLIGLVYSWLTDDPGSTVGQPKGIPERLPVLSFDLPWASTATLVIGAFVIALVGFAEPAAVARIFARKESEPWNANRELVAQGLANLTAGLSGGFPVGGSFSRTAVNNLAGARTRWSGGITGLAVLLFLPFAGVLDGLPQAVLGAVVIGSVLGLLNVKAMLRLIRTSKVDAALAWFTLATTLYLAPNVHYGVIAGLAVTIMTQLVRPLSLEDVATDSSTAANDSNDPTVAPRGLVWFGSHRRLQQALSAVIDNYPGRTVVLQIGESSTRDPRLRQILAEADDQASAANGQLVLSHSQ